MLKQILSHLFLQNVQMERFQEVAALGIYPLENPFFSAALSSSVQESTDLLFLDSICFAQFLTPSTFPNRYHASHVECDYTDTNVLISLPLLQQKYKSDLLLSFSFFCSFLFSFWNIGFFICSPPPMLNRCNM